MFILPDKFSGIVFDCDGTLAHTMPLHYQAFLETCAHFRQKPMPEPLFYAFGGVPTIRIFQRLNGEHGFSFPVEEAAEMKEQRFVVAIPRVTSIAPVVRLVHEYHGRIPLAVATGGNRDTCIRTLDAIGLADRFHAVVAAEDVIHGKPAPDVFLEAARRIAVPAPDCVAFEDADPGIASATAAGMFVIDVRPALAKWSAHPQAT